MTDDRSYKEVNYTPLHHWVREYDCAGIMYGPGDVEAIWENEWEEELGVPFRDVWDELKDTWEWQHMGDQLCEVGFEIISMMCADYVQEKGLRQPLKKEE